MKKKLVGDSTAPQSLLMAMLNVNAFGEKKTPFIIFIFFSFQMILKQMRFN